MKTKIIYFLIIFAIAFFIRISVSQTLLSDDFSYPPVSSLAGMNGWVEGYAPNPNNPIPVISSTLIFPGFPGSYVGNCILIRNDTDFNVTVTKQFTEQTSGSVYMTCMLRVDSLTPTAQYDHLLTLDQGGSLTNMRCRLMLKKYNSSTFFLGVAKFSEQSASYSPVLYNKNQTYLVVLKYKFSSVSNINDSTFLYVMNSTIPVNEPAPDQISSLGPDSPGLGELMINNHSTGVWGDGLRRSSVKIDGIRVTKSWGEAVLLAVEQTSAEVPGSFELKQNYPNPFNPSTKINFSLPKSGNVKISVFDITGKIISTIVNSELTAGTYSADFDATGLSSGIYFYRLETGDFVSTKKMTLVK